MTTTTERTDATGRTDGGTENDNDDGTDDGTDERIEDDDETIRMYRGSLTNTEQGHSKKKRS